MTKMKHTSGITVGIFVAFFLISTVVGQNDTQQDVFVVYYFGATNIGFCTAPDNIEKIKELKKNLPIKHKDNPFKFVLVCLDENLETGLKFVKKYGQWDEVAIGASYANELALNHLNAASLPSLPHIFVFKDTLSSGRWNLPVIKKRRLLVELSGEKQIGDWIEKGYPFKFDKNARK